MVNALAELKIRAQFLQRRAQAGQDLALSRLGNPEGKLRRAQCLDVVAREMGFRDYRHAAGVLEGVVDPRGYGRLLYQPACGAFLNHWYKTHGEAAAHRESHGGYLLVYDRHYLVVSAEYVEALGLDPDDSDWDRMGYDWAEPRDAHARQRLYAKLLAALPRQA